MAMHKKVRSSLLWLLICAVGFVSGFLVNEVVARTQKSELMLGKFMDQLAALYYLEKGNIEGARHVLRASGESALIAFDDLGNDISEIDPSSVRGKMLEKYKALRLKYGPIPYPDEGYMNERLDELLGQGSDRQRKEGSG